MRIKKMPLEQTNTRQNLISAATRLMWQNSYSLVSVDDICSEAGVRKGSFYHHFKSKSDLVVSLMEDHYQEYEPVLDEIFDPLKDPVERFTGFTQKILEIQTEMKRKSGCVFGALFVTLGLEMASEEEAVREKAAEILHRYQSYYAAAIRDMVEAGYIDEGTNIQDTATRVHSYILGQLILARINNSLSIIVDNLKDGIFQMIKYERNE